MKHFYSLTIILFCFVLNLLAKPIDKKEAEQLAVNFYSFYAPDGISDFSIKEVLVSEYNNSNSFYIMAFNAGGFVIISADDNAYPILGYSFTSPVSKKIKNPGLLTKFESYHKQIDYLRKLKTADLKISNAWADLRNKNLKRDLKAAGPLLSTIWNQLGEYNNLCPSNTPTGCVATAMAQIMNYHEWPEYGNSWHQFIPQTHPEYGLQTANFSTTAYDWANMVDDLTAGNSTAEKEAISTLMFHCGVSVEMDYDSEGSGANSVDVMHSLTNYFLYEHTSIQMVDFDVANETEWLDLIKNEIDNNRPVYYSGGSSADGGHAWVCDGYDDSDYLHINWGWGGYEDGFFQASAMSAGGYDFSEYNTIIIGIEPGNVAQELWWTKQASAFESQSRGIRYISAIDERVAWAVAYDGSGDGAKVKDFTRTINGGVNWISGTINAPNTTNYESSMISAIDENTAWVALFGPSGGGMIVKTTDGGQNWVQQTSAGFAAPDGFPNVVHFWDENSGFCQGDPNGAYFEIYTTSNGGETWTRVAQQNIPANTTGEYGTIGYYDVVGDTVWFATDKGQIYRSIDKGFNWEAFQTPITDVSFEISFKDANTGIIQIRKEGDKSAYITSDGGETWSVLNSTGNFYNNSFKFVPGTSLLISSGSDYETPDMGISYSVDDGATFNDYADYYKNSQFLALGAANDKGVWAGSYNSSAYKGGMWHLGEVPFTSDFSANANDICMENLANFTDNSTGFPDSWAWDFGDGADPATANTQGPHSVSYSSSGTKTITLSVSKGVENHDVAKTIHVSEGAPASLGEITGDVAVNVGETHTYSVVAQDNISYNWSMPTTNWTGTSTTNTIDVSFSNYAKSDTIRVTASNACGSSDVSKLYVQVSGTVGIQVSDNNPVLIYPNPSNGKLYLANIDNVDIKIYSNTGQLVMEKNLVSDKTEIDVGGLPTGTYYIKFILKEQAFVKKFNKI